MSKFGIRKKVELFWWRKLKAPKKEIGFFRAIFVQIKLWWIEPETERKWTQVYYGVRGSGKTLHQGKEVKKILKYLKYLYKHRPSIKRAIIYSNQLFSKEFYEANKEYLYRWEEADEIKYCPRKKCWKRGKHPLHGAYLMFDDISKIFPPDAWRMTPMWLRDYFIQGRKYGIHCLANLQDPNNVDVNFRRYIDRAFKFQKLLGNKDPDETKWEVTRIWGMYRRRRIDAEMLWAFGDMPEQQIRLMINQREEQNEELKRIGKQVDIVYDDSWRGSIHFYGKKVTSIYDTHYIVKEYSPKGFSHSELSCLDPNCKYHKVIHDVV
jgi:hypothetical protein